MLAAEALSVRFGPGCANCVQPLADGVTCPACGTVQACSDVSLQVHPGELLGIVGESGSGKSTILRCLNLDHEPNGGRVLLDGQELSGLHGAQRRRVQAERLGIVYQRAEEGLHLDVSAGGNVAERLLAVGERRYAHVRERCTVMHQAMELPADRFDAATRTYSGGMRQRTQLARALITRPRVLLLDEPTTGLDVSVQARFLDLIRRLRATSDAAMVLVSHDLAVIRMLADRVLVMRHGRIVEQGVTDRVLSDPHHPYTQLLVSSQLT